MIFGICQNSMAMLACANVNVIMSPESPTQGIAFLNIK